MKIDYKRADVVDILAETSLLTWKLIYFSIITRRYWVIYIAKGFESYYQVIRTNRMQKLANVLISFYL